MKTFTFFLLMLLLFSCKHSKETHDEIYSRHLQRKAKLTVLHTAPSPKDRSQFNLLILNDGQDMKKLRVRETLDSLYKKGVLKPLVVIGIDAGDRNREFGVAGKPDYLGHGNKASFYDAFVNDELYPYAKKQSGVRKFNCVAIAGWSLGGLSAFDFAWNHPDKISKVGVFSGSFSWRNKSAQDSSYSDETNRILFAKLKASRKKPGLQYWFCSGGTNEISNSNQYRIFSTSQNKDSIVDLFDDTPDLISLLEKKIVATRDGIVYRGLNSNCPDYESWGTVFPDFLIWAFGN
jgi:hypothetical protein